MTDVSFWDRLKMATSAASRAFYEAYVTAGATEAESFSAFGGRQVRYEILWAMYENTAYRNIHTWATSYRNQYALYRYIRGIYNPSYRLGEFWKSMLWGGELDAGAGATGAIPIATEDDKLRQAIAALWQVSNWGINKDIASLYGSVLGDVGIYIRDDTDHEQVRLEVIHPSTIKSITTDPRGFIKAYQIEETRLLNNKKVTYLETAEREDGSENVLYKTYANGQLYAWDGQNAEWSAPYGFIPLVVIQHNNVGLDWGWSEMHAGRGKFQETDDLASKLHDQIRKSIDPVWLFSGVKRGDANPSTTGAGATTDRPQPGREELPALYGPADATAKPLIADVRISEVLTTLQELLKELERDYPELQMDIWTAQGDTSGRALKVARQRAETKVKQRRQNYDSELVRAQQMAVAIAGWRNYPGFEGFDLTSYAAGKLDHSIATRPVFAVDPLDIIEEKQAFWTAVKAATDAGVSLEAALLDAGWDPARVQTIYQGLPTQ